MTTIEFKASNIERTGKDGSDPGSPICACFVLTHFSGLFRCQQSIVSSTTLRWYTAHASTSELSDVEVE